jgi:hypothetical protein
VKTIGSGKYGTANILAFDKSFPEGPITNPLKLLLDNFDFVPASVLVAEN